MGQIVFPGTQRPSPARQTRNLVFDLGGGTFDTILFELKETKNKMIFRGLSTSGDAKLGGMDFDRALMGYVLKKEGLNLDALSF